jgi:uncharacterized membrane protein HdeD (DUF308 family)
MRTTGIVFLVLGILAILEPAVAGLAIALFVGWFLIFGGLAHAAGAFGGGRVVWHVLIALIYFAGGIYLLTHPVLGLATLTLYLAVVLVAEAMLEAIAYFATRGVTGSQWLIVNAIVTVLLGGLIWRHWPSSSAWAIGTIVGVNLIMTGVSRLMLGTAARRLTAGAP